MVHIGKYAAESETDSGPESVSEYHDMPFEVSTDDEVSEDFEIDRLNGDQEIFHKTRKSTVQW